MQTWHKILPVPQSKHGTAMSLTRCQYPNPKLTNCKKSWETIKGREVFTIDKGSNGQSKGGIQQSNSS